MKKALLLSLVLAGCAVGPDYKQPEVAAPPQYKGATDWQVAQPSDTVPKGQWWKAFRDPVLDGLVERVEVSNQNLRAAEARYRQAQAGIAAARSALFPSLGASVGAQRTGGGARANGESGTRYTASLDARWEVDLWGRVRRTVEASSAGAEASAADLDNARLSLQADLATSYFLLRVTDTQIDLLEDNVTAFRKSFEIAQNRYTAGVAAKVDVVQAEAQVRSVEAQAIDLRATRAQLENAIAVLAGEPPPTFVLAKAPFKVHIPEIPAGVPSRLLERRPDIAAAERRVAQANAQIGVAQAAYFPALNLTGGAGSASSSLGNLFSASNYAWSLGLGLAATLIDFGARGAQVDASRARYDETVATYRETVLEALQEVENNLATVRWLSEETKVQQEAARLARESVVLTLNQYRAGTVSYLNVALVQASQLSEERSTVQLLGRRLAATVALIRALGGDWEPPV